MTERRARLAAFISALSDGQQRLDAFRGLTNPTLLDDLVSLDVFASPYDIESIPGGVSHPIWPPALYLTNIAADRPSDVARVIENIHTDNIQIWRDLLEAINKMPPAIATTFSARVGDWIKRSNDDRIMYRSVALMENLSSANEVEGAALIADALLEVRPARPDEGFTFDTIRLAEAQPVLGNTSLQYVAERIVCSLGIAAPSRTVELFCFKLRRALRFEGLMSSAWDHSYIWIADLADTPMHGAKSTLAHWLYRSAQELLRRDRTQLHRVLGHLAEQGQPIYRRIRIALTTEFGQPADVRAVLNESELFGNPEVKRERRELLHSWFSRLDSSDRANIISLVHAAFDEAALRHYLAENRPELNADEIVSEERAREWWRELRTVRPFVDGALASVLDEASNHFSADEPHEGIWTGPESPLSQEQLEQLSTGELLTYIASWRAPGGFFAASEAGLGRSIQAIVAARPIEFLDHVQQIKSLKPVYMYYIINALRPLVAAGRANVQSFFDLLDLSLQRREDETPPDELQGVAGNYVSSVRQLTASAISELLRSDVEIGIYRERIWFLLSDIAEDSDPTAEIDESFGVSRASSLALNSARGTALLAIFDYARWAYRINGGHGNLDVIAPEVLSLLLRHLDTEVDLSPAIRSTYGQNFISLYAMAPIWAKDHISAIFGNHPATGDDRQRAAWESYLTYSGIYDEVFDALRAQYTDSVAALEAAVHDPLDGRNERDDISEKLIIHFVVLYARGKLDLGEPESLIARILAVATPKMIASAIQYSSRVLSRDSVADAYVARLEALYDEIMTQLGRRQPSERATALASFGWWISIANHISSAWLLARLSRTLELTGGKIDMEGRVIERLAELSSTYPTETIRAVLSMTGAMNLFVFIHSRDFVRTVFANAISTGGQALDIAVGANDVLVSQGIGGYSDLFPRYGDHR